MHKQFAKLLEGVSRADGTLDLEALDKAVSAEVALRRRQAALQEQRLIAAVDATGHAMSIYDSDRRLVHCNQQFLNLYRLPKRLGRPGTPFEEILRGRVRGGSYVGDDPDRYLRDRMDFVNLRTPSTNAFTLNTGQMVAITHQPLKDGGWVSMHKDITEFNRLQEELAHRAYHDALTGLPNRHLLQQRIEDCFQDAAGEQSFALLMIDLDGFKAVNDTLGHAAGDTLLKEVASRLDASTGHDGMVGRMGGDEFAVVTEVGATAHDVHRLAIRLIDVAQQPMRIEGQPVHIGFSIGVAMAPSDGTTADDLLKNADLALYAEKNGRRGGYRFFERAMDDALRDRRQLERDLAQALENGEFELNYQPILNLKTQRFSGFEALLRWKRRDTYISPAQFIPVAEETGLIVPIGEWALRQAIAEASCWPQGLRVAINVSSVQFKRGNLVATLMNALGTGGVSPERIEIEITESVFFDNSAANLEALRQLHALGVKIALDDFGTGFSALSYLLRYPFDKIKIDGSFVRAIDNAAGAQTIVKAIAEIGRGMAITTTAEGVETPGQLRNVHAAGYSEAQGFLIARPMPSEQVREMLRGEDDRMPMPPMAQRAAS